MSKQHASERTPLLAAHNGRGSQQPFEGAARSDGRDGAISPAAQSGTSSPGQGRGLDIPMPPMRKVVILCLTVWVPVLVASIDSTIVATLVSAISSSFNRSEQAAWLGTSYLLSVCCFTPIYGRLCDVLGRKGAMLLALVTFGVGTILCGMAPSMEMLIGARVIAGIGGGGLTTCTSTILSDVIPLRNRGLYQGLTNIVYGLGNGLGGPIGGLLNDTIGWRNAFTFQAPLIAVATILCALFVHSTPPALQAAKSADSSELTAAQRIALQPSRLEKLKSIDFLGSLTLVGCVAPILLSLSFMAANDAAFTDVIVWGSLLAGILSGFAFYFVETRVAKSPVLPMFLVTQRVGGNCAIANFCLSVVTHSLIYNYPIVFQATRLQSASLAGLHLVPNSVALSVGSVLAGWYMRKTGRYYWINFFNATCMVASAALFITITPSSPEWYTYAVIVPMGFGCSGVLTSTLLALINAVPRSEIAVATGMSYLFRTTGQVVGVAGSGVILQSMLKSELRKRIADEDLISKVRHQLGVIADLPLKQRKLVIDAYATSLQAVFVFTFLGAVGTASASYFLPDDPLPDAAPSSQNSENTSRNDEEGRQNR